MLQRRGRRGQLAIFRYHVGGELAGGGRAKAMQARTVKPTGCAELLRPQGTTASHDEHGHECEETLTQAEETGEGGGRRAGC